MAGRLVSPPLGLPVVSMEPLSGPRSVGAGGTQSASGFVQTSGAPFGLWRWRFSFAPMNKAMFRHYRGWITSLHGGANATRWYFFDPDMPTPRETGINVPAHVGWSATGYDQDWSNGQPWSNGEGWKMTPSEVAVAAAASLGDTTISLADEFWGHSRGVGDFIGFYPFHFGLYMVTEVIEPGTYRIWPPLRKALTTDDSATLNPVLAMRLESEEAASAGRGLVVAEGLSVTMIEALDYDVREHFAA